jgi:pilus assembly protein Flp/PilA
LSSKQQVATTDRGRRKLLKAGKSETKGMDGSMNDVLLKMYIKFQNLKDSEEGQDLVEYALLVCLMALAAISGVNRMSGAVTKVFSNISNSLS